MKHSLEVGFSFGLTSGIITTLGLMVGLHSGTCSRLVVIGGILVIAVADAFSDALGIHVSEEFENRHTAKEVWISTISAFFSKLVFALTFIIPILLFELKTAIVVSAVWGLSILTLVSYKMARTQKVTPWKIIAEHVIIALVVIYLTHNLGDWISSRFS